MSANEAQMIVKSDKKIKQKSGRHVTIFDGPGWDLSMTDKRSQIYRIMNPFCAVVGHVINQRSLSVTSGYTTNTFIDSDTVVDLATYMNLPLTMRVQDVATQTQNQPQLGPIAPSLWTAYYDTGAVHFHRLQHRWLIKNISTHTVILIMKEWGCKRDGLVQHSVEKLWEQELKMNLLNATASTAIVGQSIWGLRELDDPDEVTYERGVGQAGSPIYEYWYQKHFTRIVIPPGQFFEYHQITDVHPVAMQTLTMLQGDNAVPATTKFIYKKGFSSCITFSLTGQLVSASGAQDVGEPNPPGTNTTNYKFSELSGGSAQLTLSKESHVCVYGSLKEHDIQLPFLYERQAGSGTGYWADIIEEQQVNVNPRVNEREVYEVNL